MGLRVRTWFALVLLAALMTAADALQSPQGDYRPLGLQRDRGYFAQLPFESVDMVNGNLILTFTDLVLPGDAGMDLRFVRTYNHQDNRRWTFGFAGVPLLVQLPNGRPQPPACCSSEHPRLVTADGAAHQAVSVNNLLTDTEFITGDFWRYTTTNRRLTLPNGWVATYEPGDPPGGAMLLEVHDEFGNTIVPEWAAGAQSPRRLERVTQTVGSTTRIVTFTYDEQSGFMPKTMTWTDGGAGGTWNYDYDYEIPGGAGRQLTKVTPPAGGAWTYAYGYNGLAGTVAVTTPHGGVVTYAFDDVVLPSYEENHRSVVTTRTTGGVAPAGVWSFAFDQVPGEASGAVDTPDGRRIEFDHEPGDLNAPPLGPSWLMKQKVLREAGQERARLNRTFVALPVPNFRELKVVASETLLQNGQTYSTQFEYSNDNFGDYHQPFRITETGSATRTTTRQFDYDFSNYILRKLKSETVEVSGGGAFTTSYEYDNATGFLTSQSAFGVVTHFTPDARGNRATATDARDNTTSFSYEWGVVKDTSTPEYGITRTIRPDGAVMSETRNGDTTSFSYDPIGRVTAVSAPDSLPTVTTYDAGSTWVSVDRGPSQTVTWLDGFGRPIATDTTPNLRTETEYDTDGRVTFQSYPFAPGGTRNGDAFSYDALGRVTQVAHRTGTTTISTVGYEYLGNVRRITDEEGKTTEQEWQTFGDPSDGRLISVTDPANKLWRYTYNTLGSLLSVDAPGGEGDRFWQYTAENFLRLEIHPESGTTGYDYDAVGNVRRKTDANGKVTEYVYDGNNRLRFIDATDPLDAADDVEIEYDDADNRTRVANALVDSTFVYEHGRLRSRTDAYAGHSLTTTYEYDNRDNLIEIAYPSDREIRYDFDAANRITSVYQAGGPQFATDITYHPSGALAGFNFGNGTEERLEFDDRYRPGLLRSGRLAEAGTANRLYLDYDYDDVGNVLAITDERGGAWSSSFGYDALDRLESVNGFGATTYTYDDLGNRLTKGPIAYHYDGATQRMMSVTGAPEAGSYAYDHAGNMLSDPSGVYTYTPFNMLESATVGGVRNSYAYDGDGMRKVKSTAKGQFYYVHGPASQLLAEYQASTGTPELVREYIYLGAKLVASVGRPDVPEPPLSVVVTQPAAGDKLPDSEPVTLTAVAAAVTGSIDRVEFYRDGSLLGTAAAAPYTLAWTTPTVSVNTEVTLLARVVKATGEVAVSAPVRVIVFPVGRVQGVTTSPNPAEDVPVTVTATGNTNPCGAVHFDFGDGTEPTTYPLPEAWPGGPSFLPFAATHAYAEPGTFTITASGHGNCMDVATTTIVVAGNHAPQVSLTSPASNASFAGPAAVTLQADATDDGAIVSVEFFAGATLIGTDTTAPYSVVWSGAPFGTHAITAKATDDGGKTRTSAAVSISVVHLSGVTVTPSNVVTGQTATITVSGDAATCEAIHIDFGDGSGQTFANATPPFSTTRSWSTAGAKNVVATGQGPCTGAVSTTVSVTGNVAPSVALTAPASGSTFELPATIVLSATAADSDGSVAQVEFYAGATLLAIVTSPPYTFGWSPSAPGAITLTAKAKDNAGAVTTSAAVGVTVNPNAPPSVSLTSPAGGSAFLSGAAIAMTASASDGDGINRVEFYAGAVLLSTDTVAPYAFTWTNAPAGVHGLTAKAVDAVGTVATSTPVSVSVGHLASVVASPGSVVVGQPATVTVSGSSVCESVQVNYGDGQTPQTYAQALPVSDSRTWSTTGTKTITATGQSICTGQVQTTVAVNANPAPSVSLTAPANGSVHTTGTTITLTATATDAHGIAYVEFKNGSTVLGTDASAPYSFAWPAVPPGTHSLTARAVDIYGAAASSAAASIVVRDVESVTVSPTVPVAGQAALITVYGSSVCGAVTVYFGDGTHNTYALNGLPMSTLHTWATGGAKTVTAVGESTCHGTATLGITVNSPPTVTLTAPVSGSTFTSPASIALAATASDAGGSIASVSFYAGSTLLATDTSAPYAYTWSSVPNGTYWVYAIGVDNQGAVASSSGATVTVQNPAPSTVLGVSVSPSPTTAGQWAAITVTGTNPCGAVQINFGDGEAPYLPIESLPYTTYHAWASPGTYTVTATGQGYCVGQASASHTVTAAGGTAAAPLAAPPGVNFEVGSSKFESWNELPLVIDSLDGSDAEPPDVDALFDVHTSAPSASGLGASTLTPAGDAGANGAAATLPAVSLTVDLVGNGTGSVASSPVGINCAGQGVSCTASFADGSPVTLTATPDVSMQFVGWAGGCGGTTTSCVVTLAQAQYVVATFRAVPPPVTHFYHADVLGSVRLVTDETGAAVRRHDYFPFGEEASALVADRIQFTGKERDAESAFDYFGARYYRNLAGRFTTVDPIMTVGAASVDPQRWNRYAYARGNPLRYIDPTGGAIEFVGSEAERGNALALFQGAVGRDAAAFLYINEIVVDGKVRYFLGIRGDLGDFMRLGEAAQGLANLVVHESIVEFKVTNENLGRYGGARTIAAGENGNVQVVVNPDQARVALNPGTLLGASRFAEGALVRPLVAEVAAWHELGHAWGVVNGRSLSRTNPEALHWENVMRERLYGPLGKWNARRIRH